MHEEVNAEGKKRKKLRECIKCRHFFDCEGVPMHVIRCLMYRERKDGRSKMD